MYCLNVSLFKILFEVLFSVTHVIFNFYFIGDVLLEHSTPRDGEGSLYGDTLFGAILSTSCLPRSGRTYRPNEQVSSFVVVAKIIDVLLKFFLKSNNFLLSLVSV